MFASLETAQSVSSRPTSHRLVAYLPVGVAAVAYLLTPARYVLGGDNAEFVTLFAGPGVAHPSGYPLYTLYLRLAAFVVPGEAPIASALATSFLAIASVFLFAFAARRWGASPLATGVATAFYAFSPLAWHLGTHAEVFALHILIGTAILAAAAPVETSGRRAQAAAFGLGLLAGLGLSNNLTIVTLAPLGLCAAFLLVKRDGRFAAKAALAVFGLLLGLGPYLALPSLAADSDALWVWGDQSSWAGVWSHAIREDFGTFQFGIYQGEGIAAQQIAEFFYAMIVNTHLVGAVRGAAGLVVLLRTRSGGARLLAWSVAASIILCGPALLARMNLAPDGVAERVIERFYLLPQMLLLFCSAFAIDAVLARRRVVYDFTGPAVTVISCLLLVVGVARVQNARNSAVDDYLRNTLEMLPQNAVLLGTGDHRLFGFLYLRQVAAVRTDVVYVDASMLLYPWYHNRIERELGRSVDGVNHNERSVSMPMVIGSLQSQGFDVYITNVVSETIPAAYRLLPVGTAFQVLRADVPAPPLEELARRNRAVAVNFRIDPAPPSDRDSWAALVYEDYARPWRELARAYRSAGRDDVAEIMEGYVAKLTEGRDLQP